MKVILQRIRKLVRRRVAPPATPLSDIERARRLIAAIDAGGIPLAPRQIRHIAEGLGLEVSHKARMEDTIARIRAALTWVTPP